MVQKDIPEGKFTVETFAEKVGLKRQSAVNLLSKLKAQGYVKTSGGGAQKRIYTISRTPIIKTNGFYDFVNKHSPEKLVPKFAHHVIGNYTVEHAIIDGIKIGDSRTLDSVMHLFFHVKSWKRLFDLAKKYRLSGDVRNLYKKARERVKCRRMPARYLG